MPFLFGCVSNVHHPVMQICTGDCLMQSPALVKSSESVRRNWSNTPPPRDISKNIIGWESIGINTEKKGIRTCTDKRGLKMPKLAQKENI